MEEPDPSRTFYKRIFRIQASKRMCEQTRGAGDKAKRTTNDTSISTYDLDSLRE